MLAARSLLFKCRLSTFRNSRGQLDDLATLAAKFLAAHLARPPNWSRPFGWRKPIAECCGMLFSQQLEANRHAHTMALVSPRDLAQLLLVALVQVAPSKTFTLQAQLASSGSPTGRPAGQSARSLARLLIRLASLLEAERERERERATCWPACECADCRLGSEFRARPCGRVQSADQRGKAASRPVPPPRRGAQMID